MLWSKTIVRIKSHVNRMGYLIDFFLSLQESKFQQTKAARPTPILGNGKNTEDMCKLLDDRAPLCPRHPTHFIASFKLLIADSGLTSVLYHQYPSRRPFETRDMLVKLSKSLPAPCN